MQEVPTGHITVTFKAYREGSQWVSECVELAVASCGDTLQDAFDAIEDATLLYLRTIEELGERERVFSERGIEVIPGPPPTDDREVEIRARPHEYVSPETVPIPVPA